MSDRGTLGSAGSYPELRALVAQRRKQLGLSQLAVDDLAGVQQGYTGKLECGARCFGDMSLGAVLGALGINLAVVLAAGKQAKAAGNHNVSAKSFHEARKKLSSGGGHARAAKLDVKTRSAIAGLGGLKRAARIRERKAEDERKAKAAERLSAKKARDSGEAGAG